MDHRLCPTVSIGYDEGGEQARCTDYNATLSNAANLNLTNYNFNATSGDKS